MTGCSAINCNAHSSKGDTFHRFPADPERRRKWIINCRRDKWSNCSSSARLCSKHFENGQFETHRQDGKRKLMPFAVPTLFDVPNPPKRLDSQRKSCYKRRTNDDHKEVSHTHSNESNKFVGDQNSPEILDTQHTSNYKRTFGDQNQISLERGAEVGKEGKNCDSCLEYQLEITRLNAIIAEGKDELIKYKTLLNKFLTDEQINTLSQERKFIVKWSSDGILKGLKLRFALGKNGYNFIRETGYPAPAYSTLNRRVCGVKVGFGILTSIIDLMKMKVECMTAFERDCTLMVDEMEISGEVDFDKQKRMFVGEVTLGDKSKTGNHLTVVALRGLNTRWKQIVACHVTGPSTTGSDMKSLILGVIDAVEKIGLNICAVVSDMGGNNRGLWTELGVKVTRSERINSFSFNERRIFVFADAPHLLKNWKQALLSSTVYLPNNVVDSENLPTNIITGKYVADLYKLELNSSTGLRLLHHLSNDIINPNQFSKMHVGKAMQFMSNKTAGAIEAAVKLKMLPQEALSTAWFIRLLAQWFELCNSRKRACSLTLRNINKKKEFITKCINIMENTIINKGWKPLNTGSILTSLSFINVATNNSAKGYRFILGSRLSQDGLENIFSRIRNRSALKPSALASLKAIKLICLSQYISDIQNTNYFSDSDRFLLDYASVNNVATVDGIAHNIDDIETDSAPTNNLLSDSDNVNIYYIGGSCVNYIRKQVGICDNCKEFVCTTTDNDHNYAISHDMLVTTCNVGGLKKPSDLVYDLLKEAELYIQKYKTHIISGSNIDNKLKVCINNNKHLFPQCCNLIDKLLQYYIVVRGVSLKKFLSAKRKCSLESFASKSMNKKSKLR